MLTFRDLLARFDQEIKQINLHMQRLAVIRKDLLELVEPTDVRKASQATLKSKGLTRIYKCNIKDCMFLVQDDADLKKHFSKYHDDKEIPRIDVLEAHVLASQVANVLMKWFARQKEIISQNRQEEEEPFPEKTEPSKEKSSNSQDNEMTE